MEKKGPLYIKTKSGILIRLSAVLGTEDNEDNKGSTTCSEATVCELSPESVITEEEFYKRGLKNAKEIYKTRFKPLVEAIKIHGSLTPKEISQITRRSIAEEMGYLKRLYDARLVHKEGNVYNLTDEDLTGLRSVFGITI